MTFECAINVTGYSLTFSYGGSINAVLQHTNLPGGGIKIMTTFIVTSTLNGTDVRCIADDGNIPLFTSLTYVYVQG